MIMGMIVVSTTQRHAEVVLAVLVVAYIVWATILCSRIILSARK